MTRSLRTYAGLALACAVTASVSAQNPQCWNPTLGTNLGLTDDSVASGLGLNFAFDMPGGGQTTSIDVSSNGFVWLVSSGSGNSRCCNGDVNGLLNDPVQICPWWTDLNPSAGGAVYFDSGATSATITWVDVPEFSSGGSNTFQVTLFQGGAFQLSYAALTTPGSHDVLVGCSPGNGVADPGEIDFSTVPFASGGVPTIYELFTNGVDPRDLAGGALYFQPDGGGGYIVIPIGPCASAAAYGAGCPGNPVFYEEFTGAPAFDLANSGFLFAPNAVGGYAVSAVPGATIDLGFSNNLNLGDDDLSPSLALGFTMSMPGIGPVSSITVDSNGRIGFPLPYSDYVEAVSELLATAMIAVAWDDLNPSAGGGVYFDQLAGKSMVTWDSVPEYPGVGANTMQIQFFPNGNILIVYGAMSLTDCLVGYSPGNIADPGNTDLSTAMPFSLAGGALTHVNGGGSYPVLGQTLNLDLGGVPSNAVVAAFNLGVSPLNFDLTPLGMPGCTLLASGEVSLPAAITGPTARSALPLPLIASLAGITLRTQGLVIAPGVNAFGAISSNAIAQTLGY